MNSYNIASIQKEAYQQFYPDISTITIDAIISFWIEKDRTFLYAHPEYEVWPSTKKEILLSLDKAAEGFPLAYITGKKEFFGLEFDVSPEVLVPRPETEMIVEYVHDWLKSSNLSHPTILDIGTGSGILGITLGTLNRNAIITCTDISKGALLLVGNNAKYHGISDQMRIIESNLFENISGAFDVIVSNLPYIDTNLLGDLDVTRWEPALALDGGDMGLDLFIRFFSDAPAFLRTAGLIALEIGWDQGENVTRLARKAFPEKTVRCVQDFAGQDRMILIK